MHRAILGSYGGGVSYEGGIPVELGGLYGRSQEKKLQEKGLAFFLKPSVLNHTNVCELLIRALIGTAAHFCEK
jgi:hypothetical protein